MTVAIGLMRHFHGQPVPGERLVSETAEIHGMTGNCIGVGCDHVGAGGDVASVHFRHKLGVRFQRMAAPDAVVHRRAEALQQSRGVWLPEVTEPGEAATLLPVAAAAEPGARPLGADVTTVAIGPEGGWSSHELEIAAATVSIGSTVLRVETAAIVAAVHLVQHAE